jgi:ABC-2 type transport system permease protein
MKLQRLRAVARKEFLHVWRDPLSLAMALLMPLILLFLFGYALTLDVDRVPLLVWDQSGTPVSRELVSRFEGSRYFAVCGFAVDYRQIERAIDRRDALLALVIPRDFARDTGAGRDATVQLIVDGSDANTATIAMGYAESVVQGFSTDLMLQAIRRAGGREMRWPLEVRLRAWFNDDLDSRNYMIPGLIAVLMMIIAALLTSLTVAREWERGTMEQLISTPVKGWELVLGKLVPYFAVGMLDVLLAVGMGELLFRVPFRGSLALVFASAAVFLVGALAMGLLISIAARTQALANQMAMVMTFVPAFLLSGLIFAIANMPVPIRAATYLVPARFFITVLRGIYMKGVGLEVLGVPILFLAGFAAVMLIVANRRFRKNLE